MPTALLIIFIGAIIFLGNFLVGFFNRTRIPDILGLLLLGLLIGPVFEIVRPSDFGAIGPIFTNIVLVFILFESGLDLHFEEMKKSLRGSFNLTILNFVVTMLVVAGVCFYFTSLDWLSALITGSILGGTSSAVVTTLVKKVAVRESTSTVLVIESAVSDVFTLGIPITLMGLYAGGVVEPGMLIGQMLSSLVLALAIGFFGGLLWSVLLHESKILRRTRFSTPAFAFIIYGIAELFGFSGPITALTFGVTLGNIYLLRSKLMDRFIIRKSIEMKENEKSFFSEIVFLLRTFFFIYIGLSIRLDDKFSILLGLITTVLLFLIRIPVVGASTPKDTPVFDSAIMCIMIPKGLGAAVLATLPSQRGMPTGDLIQTITFSVILFTTLISTILFFMVERKWIMPVFSLIFRNRRKNPWAEAKPATLANEVLLENET
ncbi:MAG: cation:proton antiporter [Saprospiraceae bacterium]